MNEQIENLLYEALETEMGGVEIYTNAVASARNADARLAETTTRRRDGRRWRGSC